MAASAVILTFLTPAEWARRVAASAAILIFALVDRAVISALGGSFAGSLADSYVATGATIGSNVAPRLGGLQYAGRNGQPVSDRGGRSPCQGECPRALGTRFAQCRRGYRVALAHLQGGIPLARLWRGFAGSA